MGCAGNVPFPMGRFMERAMKFDLEMAYFGGFKSATQTKAGAGYTFRISDHGPGYRKYHPDELRFV